MTLDQPTMTTTIIPHDPLTPLDPNVDPTPAAVRLLREEMYANARSLKTSYGGGREGHLGQLMQADRYLAFAGVPYTLSDQAPVFSPHWATTSQRSQLSTTAKHGGNRGHGSGTTRTRTHRNQTCRKEYTDAQVKFNASKAEWEAAHEFKRTMQKLIIQAVPRVHLLDVRCSMFGYSDIEPGEVLDYLIDTSGQITSEELAENLEKLKAPWNPNTPIKNAFANGELCRAFARDGAEPIPDWHYIHTMVNTFEQRGVLQQAVYAWRTIPEGDRDMTTLKAHFTTADTIRRKHPDTMQQVLSANLTDGGTPSPGRRKLYCWTQGLCAHASADCRTPATGHIKTATIDNWEKLQGTPPRRKRGNDDEKDRVAKCHKQRNRKKDKAEAKALAATRALVTQADAQTIEE
jgi:hypothetical protein